LYNALTINDEHATQTHTLFLDQNAIVSADTVSCVTEQWNIDLAKAAILPRYVLPVPKRVLSVNRNEDNAAIAIFELVKTVLKCENFCRAHEAEGSRYEHDDEPWCVWARRS
jgi:hypothetical protein